MVERIVIIGAGQAAQALIESLRKRGFDGPITLVGEEPSPPYQRPPLTKAYLLGEISVERLAYKPMRFYEEAGVETRFAVRAMAVDREEKTVTLGDGLRLPYDKLVLATGARPRRLPEAIGGALPGVFVARDLADADALAAELRPGRRLLVIGGGYIGLEAAAVATKLGLEVKLAEREGRILSRVACAETADYFRTLHNGAGVEILEGASVTRIVPGRDGRAEAAELEEGGRIEFDVCLVGVGVAPQDGIAVEAGLAAQDGVLVDPSCRSSDPDVLAIGDCARFPYRGASIRLESVQNAIDQAEAAAAALTGVEASYDPVPWFWSDQYDVKLQIAGLGRYGDVAQDRVVTRPGAREGAQSHWYFSDEVAGPRLLAVDAMNDPRAFMQGRRWLEAGLSPDPLDLADPANDLKSLVTAPAAA